MKVTADACGFVSWSNECDFGLLDPYDVADARLLVPGVYDPCQIEVKDDPWFEVGMVVEVMKSENRCRSRCPDARALLEIEVAPKGS